MEPVIDFNDTTSPQIDSPDETSNDINIMPDMPDTSTATPPSLNSKSSSSSKSSSLAMKSSSSNDNKNIDTSSSIANPFIPTVKEEERNAFLLKVPEYQKKVNEGDYSISKRILKDTKHNIKNILAKQCELEKIYNVITSPCNSKKTAEQIQGLHRQFDNGTRAACQEFDRLVDNYGNAHLNVRDKGMTEMCKCLTEFNKDNCTCHIDLTEKLQVDNFITTLLDYLNVRVEPDYDFTATIDKKYLFDQDICKLLEYSCQLDKADQIPTGCTDENEKIIKACLFEDFGGNAWDYGIRKHTSPAIRHLSKLVDQTKVLKDMLLKKEELVLDFFNTNNLLSVQLYFMYILIYSIKIYYL